MRRAFLSRLSLLPVKMDVVMSGSSLLKFLCACRTRLVRSARNRTFFTQFAFVSTSTSDMATRVLPVPVAMTMRLRRRLFSNAEQAALMAFFW